MISDAQELTGIDYSTSTGFNIGALIITAILIVVCATWW